MIYRIDVIWTPLSNRTPLTANSNTTPVKTPILSKKLVNFLGKFELTPPKNPVWKIEPQGCNNVDKVIKVKIF